MNTAIWISFATPYLSSITRDESFVHSPMPLDGALAYAAYWRYALENGLTDVAPTDGRIGDGLLERVIYPELEKVFEKTTVGEILGDPQVTNDVYLVSSGFPMQDGKVYFKIGARYLHLPTGEQLSFEYDVQPIRRRVIPERLTVLGINPIPITGKTPNEGIDTSRGGLKAIDNRITTWAIFDYVWYAQVKDEQRLRELLDVLQFQGMGKKRSAGFGKIMGYKIFKRGEGQVELRYEEDRRVFLKYNGQSVLMRPLPYRAITQSKHQVALTNLMIEYGCGSKPPYWNSREVIVREGTTFNFQGG
jgi:hypothetical protein